MDVGTILSTLYLNMAERAGWQNLRDGKLIIGTILYLCADKSDKVLIMKV